MTVTPGVTSERNYYDDLFERLLARCSAALAVELVAEAYLDGKPQVLRKKRTTRRERDLLFWSSRSVVECPPESWNSELMVLALARYLGQAPVGAEGVLPRVAKVAPAALVRAVRCSGLVLNQQSPRRREPEEAAVGQAGVLELCRVLTIFDLAYRQRLATLDLQKALLSDLSAFDLLVYASLYAFECLVPGDFGALTLALQAMLVQNATVSLASVVHVFVLRTFGADYPRESSAMQVAPQLSAYALEACADDLKSSRAWATVQQAAEAWRARLPKNQGEWLGWLITLSQADLIDLLSLCSALTVNALPAANASASADAIASALGLDMADWWEPTAEGYLNHVPKAQIVEALKEAGPDLAGGGIEGMKKDALVSVAASRLAGKRWLPQPLRRPPA